MARTRSTSRQPVHGSACWLRQRRAESPRPTLSASAHKASASSGGMAMRSALSKAAATWVQSWCAEGRSVPVHALHAYGDVPCTTAYGDRVCRTSRPRQAAGCDPRASPGTDNTSRRTEARHVVPTASEAAHRRHACVKGTGGPLHLRGTAARYRRACMVCVRAPAARLRRRVIRFLRVLMNSSKNCLRERVWGTVLANIAATAGYSAKICRSSAGVMLMLTLPERASTGASSTPSSFDGRPIF